MGTLKKLELYLNMKFLIAAFLIVSCIHASSGCRCHNVYEPVCGVDGQTYSNPCRADCRGVAIICTGECPCKDCCTGQNEICEDSYKGEGSDVYHFLKYCGNGCYCYYDPLNMYG